MGPLRQKLVKLLTSDTAWKKAEQRQVSEHLALVREVEALNAIEVHDMIADLEKAL